MPRLTSPRPEERRKSSSDFPNSNPLDNDDGDSQENPEKTRENDLHHRQQHRHQQQMQELQNSNNNDQAIATESFHLNIPSHSKTPSPQKRSKANDDKGYKDDGQQVVKRGRVAMDQSSPKKKLLHR